jgi:hypothetical protein
MPTDTTHECPAPGCEQRVPFERFACAAHWFTIPRMRRDALWYEFRHHFGEDSYFAARGNCLRSLGIADEAIADLNADVA